MTAGCTIHGFALMHQLPKRHYYITDIMIMTGGETCYFKIIHGYIYIYIYIIYICYIYIHTTIEHNQKNGRGLMWAEETHRVHSVQIPTYQDKRNIYIYL